MALLLCIDTATETATIGLCNNNMTIASATNEEQKHHAAFVQPAVQSIMQSHSFSYNDIDAVAVVNGPGSYTGLRVGLASAKGICYASGKPLILLNTLEVMAAAAIERLSDLNALYCAVIDARRDEVFAGLYDAFLHPLLPPQPLRIDKNSFGFFLNDHKIFFFGSGHNKCGTFINHENAILSNVSYSLPQINRLAQKQYTQKKFSDIAYAEPFYTKDFYSPGKQKGIF